MAAPQSTAPPRSRAFSVKSEVSHKSNKSHKSHNSQNSEDKARRSLHTKADPTVAMYELQPGMPFPPHVGLAVAHHQTSPF